MTIDELLDAEAARGAPRAPRSGPITAVTLAVVAAVVVITSIRAGWPANPVAAVAFAAMVAAAAAVAFKPLRRAWNRRWSTRLCRRAEPLVDCVNTDRLRRARAFAVLASISPGITLEVFTRKVARNGPEVTLCLTPGLGASASVDELTRQFRLAGTATADAWHRCLGALDFDQVGELLDDRGVDDAVAALVIEQRWRQHTDDVVAEIVEIHEILAGAGDDAAETFVALADEWDATLVELAATVADVHAQPA